MADLMRDHLLAALDFTFEKSGWGWHEPLLPALQELTAEQAASKPEGRHSIWEIVEHLTLWKAYMAGRMAGEPRRPRGWEKEMDWPVVPMVSTEAWRRTVERLVEAQQRLRAELFKRSDADLQSPLPETKVSVAAIFQGLIAHDSYHGGQIRQIRALHRSTAARRDPVSDVLAEAVRYRYPRGHARVLRMVADLSDEQFHWRPTPTAHSIAFNLWHLARWADWLRVHLLRHVPARLPSVEGADRQVWHAEELAATWGLDSTQLGWSETGKDMDDTIAASLTLPPKDVVIDYARRAFAAVEQLLETLTDEDLRITYEGENGKLYSVGGTFLSFAVHTDFHRGQIAALRRAQGLPRVIG